MPQDVFAKFTNSRSTQLRIRRQSRHQRLARKGLVQHVVKICERSWVLQCPCLSRAASDGAAATKAAKRQKVELTVGDKGVFFTTVNTGSPWLVTRNRQFCFVLRLVCLREAVLLTRNATFRTCLRMCRPSDQEGW